MKAGIITIGDELLIGQTINTNLSWIEENLSQIGIEVLQSATIQDDEKAIRETLNNFLEKVNIIIITGGLGPTNDDITKATLTRFFNTELVLDPIALENVKSIFKNLGQEMPEINIQQAMVPKTAKIIENQKGTAPGMWFHKNGKDIFSIPGVPYEMKHMMATEILPALKEKYNTKSIYYETVMVQGIGESSLAEIIKDWEDNLYAQGLKLAYLPSPGLIRLRISSSKGIEDQKLIKDLKMELAQLIPSFLYALEEASIFEVVGELLRKRNLTLGTIESCTGGGIANSFIQFSGASDFFMGGLITYSNEKKIELVKVSEKTLLQYGAVSKEVALEMAKNGRNILQTDYTIAVTGIAGPNGGSEEKPVGTVWIAISSLEKTIAKKFLFGKDRLRNIIKTELTAANLLRKMILEINE